MNKLNRMIVMALSLVLVVGVTGCSKNDTPDPESNKPPVVDNTEDNTNNENNTDIEDVGTGDTGTEDTDTEGNIDTEDTDTSTDKVVMSSANERLKYIVYQARDEETNEYLKADITNENGFLAILDIAEEDVTEYVVSTSLMNVKAYMVAIFKPAEGKDEIITEKLNAYKDSMIKSFEFYLQDQLEVAKDARIFATSGYIGIVMCDGADVIESSITESLKNIDAIGVDESLEPQLKEKITFREVYQMWNDFNDDKDAAYETYNYDYFDQFKFEDVGSGQIVLHSTVDMSYEIFVGFKSETDKVEYINFVDIEDETHGINVIEDDLDAFINSF